MLEGEADVSKIPNPNIALYSGLLNPDGWEGTENTTYPPEPMLKLGAASVGIAGWGMKLVAGDHVSSPEVSLIIHLT